MEFHKFLLSALLVLCAAFVFKKKIAQVIRAEDAVLEPVNGNAEVLNIEDVEEVEALAKYHCPEEISSRDLPFMK
ncbi:MAG: hypothetical protein ACD_9C00155G0005 [uncultured bacterium]|nr:MAG: hypothetical protein ACD_9C00155G0005 [uncultured bacterium]KKQ45576.1 MAG: hypothetical protein US63_C0014G0008 [Candidatus Moranbacteria bacterium GW2011_GWC2_37_8]KKQ62279.1 MAG: hypothetical protein US82_C0015G0008 [Parcubacteria group bacterium GW2011_GWC1_38_22]KKQ81149.1 MAG: hypothetical protein UT03_C0010G0004 [Candidatus Moranbacteria bacterium GW2011_GWD2_38_7]